MGASGIFKVAIKLLEYTKHGQKLRFLLAQSA
jgi:hypothetical protein